MLKKIAAAFGFFVGALALAWAANIPLVPSTPQFNEPSQIVGTLNTFINTLQGQPTAINNNIPGVVSFGTFCTASGASPQTCNGQRGLVTSGTLTTAAATNANYVINDNLVTAASVCQVTVASYSGTLVTNGYPQPLVSTTGAGTITVSLTNTHAANALNGTVGIAFACIQ